MIQIDVMHQQIVNFGFFDYIHFLGLTPNVLEINVVILSKYCQRIFTLVRTIECFENLVGINWGEKNDASKQRSWFLKTKKVSFRKPNRKFPKLKVRENKASKTLKSKFAKTRKWVPEDQFKIQAFFVYTSEWNIFDRNWPNVNFTNILREAFMCANPKSTKKYSQIVSLFVLLGSPHVKASRKMLMKNNDNNLLSYLLSTSKISRFKRTDW